MILQELETTFGIAALVVAEIDGAGGRETGAVGHRQLEGAGVREDHIQPLAGPE
jgi:hypothetical protein